MVVNKALAKESARACYRDYFTADRLCQKSVRLMEQNGDMSYSKLPTKSGTFCVLQGAAASRGDQEPESFS
jgi:hypothetical protein